MADDSQKRHPIKVKVAKIEEENRIAVLNAGTNAGVKKGQKYLVYKSGDEVFDPDTRESLGQVELVRGYGIVVDVNGKLSYLQAVRHKEPRVHRLDNLFAGLQHQKNISAVLRLKSLEDRDLYSIDHRKYDKTEFQGIKVGDMARLITDYS